MELLPVFLYGLFLTFILSYSLVEFYLLLVFLFAERRNKTVKKKLEGNVSAFQPFVTVQLPVYNEMHVVQRLIDAVCTISYPLDKLEIQVLDDSDDQSFLLAEERVLFWRERGVNIVHIRRSNRTGFKAGALAYGLSLAKGDFIAIFDADFIPENNFLSTCMPYFMDEKTGMVQSRWDHLNKDYSILTRLQAFALDAHFSVEQCARNAAGHFINFNGTAGVWRKSCITDAGGWSSDTLTEDLDLSYRAQLKGWQFIYVEELPSPAELPAEMNALKAQQFRWSKGAAECAKKNLKKVLQSPDVKWSSRIAAVFHLLNSFLYICIFAIGLLSLPVVLVVVGYPEHAQIYSLLVVFYLSMVFITLFYFVSEWYRAKNKWKAVLGFLYLYPLFLSVSMGLSLYNAVGVFEGYTGKKSSFVRTPKFSITGKNGSWRGSGYVLKGLPPVVYAEGFFFLYFLFSAFITVQLGFYSALPFYSLLCGGFGFVFLLSITHYIKQKNN